MEKQIKERAFLYCRVSTEEQEKGYSLNSQLDKLREYCKDKFEIVGEIKTHESAKVEGRVHFNEMLARVEKEKILNVVVWATDRLSRNADDIARVKKLVAKGIKFHLVSENQILVPGDYNGEFVFGIKALTVERDNKDKGAKVKAGLERKFKEGKWIGFARVGYLNFIKEGGKRTIILDSDRAPKVKILFELYDTGKYSLRGLRKEAERIGLRIKENPPEPKPERKDKMTEIEEAEWQEDMIKWQDKEKKRRKPGPLTVSAIEKMLKSSFYVGEMKMKKNGNNGNHPEIISNPNGKHPAIISRELFDSVQKRLIEARKNMVAERRPNDSFPFRQFAKCGYCGSKLTAGRTVKELKNGEVKEFVYYHCSKMKNPDCQGRPYKDDEMDALVSSGIKNINIETEVFERLRRKIEKTNIKEEKVNQKELNRLESLLKKELARIEMIYEDRLAGRISSELHDKKVKESQEKAAEIKAEIAEVTNKLNDKWREQSVEAVNAFVKLGDRFSKLDAKGKARILDGVLEKCLLKGDKIEFVWWQPWASIFSYSEALKELADDVTPEDDAKEKTPILSNIATV